MKQLYALVAGIATSLTASAGWGTSIDTPVALFKTGTISYVNEVEAAPDGSVWALIYEPNTSQAAGEEDIKNVVYEYRLQHWDADGNPTFDSEGLLVSDYGNISFTMVNDLLAVDRDGNAIVTVSDARNANTPSSGSLSFTAYKISPDGQFIWGEDGVALSDPTKTSLVAYMNQTQLEDGSYVFAWVAGDDSQNLSIYLQRLSPDGKALWDLDKLAMTGDQCQNPHLVNSGDNTCILVYSRKASQIFYARKIDFEGEPVWADDCRIYRGGWGGIPVHSIIDVIPSGNGGVLMAWNDDRAFTNVESAYLSYVTPDGKLGFANAADEGDVKLSYDGLRAFNCKASVAADGSCFYATFRVTNSNQAWQGVKIQKISLDGELLFGDDAKEIAPYEEASYGYLSIKPDNANGAVAFFEQYRGTFDQQGFATRFDADGNQLWNNGAPIAVTLPGRAATNLSSQTLPGAQSWLLNWADGGTDAENKLPTYYMTILNDDGTFGLRSAAIESVGSDTPGEIKAIGSTLEAPGEPDGSTVTAYGIDGRIISKATVSNGHADLNLPAGIYLIKTDSGATAKVSIK